MREEHSFGVLLDTDRLATFPALDYYFDLAVILPLSLQNASQRPDRVDLIRLWLINGSVVLCCEENIPFPGHRFFQRFHAACTPDLKSDFCKRENNDIADGNHRVPTNVRRHLIAEFLHIQ